MRFLHLYTNVPKRSSSLPTQYFNLGSVFFRQGRASLYILHDTFDIYIGDIKKPVTMSSLISTIKKLLCLYLNVPKRSSSLPTQDCKLWFILRQVGGRNYVLHDTFGVLIDCIKSFEARSSLGSTIRKFKFSFRGNPSRLLWSLGVKLPLFRELKRPLFKIRKGPGEGPLG